MPKIDFKFCIALRERHFQRRPLWGARKRLYHIINHIWKKKSSEKELSIQTYSSWRHRICSIYSIISSKRKLLKKIYLVELTLRDRYIQVETRLDAKQNVVPYTRSCLGGQCVARHQRAPALLPAQSVAVYCNFV